MFSTDGRTNLWLVIVTFPPTFLSPVPKNNPEKLPAVGVIVILEPIPVIDGRLKPLSAGTVVVAIAIVPPIRLNCGKFKLRRLAIVAGCKFVPTVNSCGIEILVREDRVLG
jgi:hypothetical protein